MPKICDNEKVVNKYCRDIISGKKIACKEQRQTVERYLSDKKSKKWDFKRDDANFVIDFIQGVFVHKKGETMTGEPLTNKSLKLTPWQMFVIYDLLCFYEKGTNIRRFHEAFILLARKNGKSSFAAALAFALATLDRMSGSTCYIIGASQRQSKQSFDFMTHTLNFRGDVKKSAQKRNADPYKCKIIDNNQEHSIEKHFEDGGTLFVEALAANPDKQDSLNANLVIADELHAYKTPKQYNILKEATKAYRNKLVIGITTAGDDVNSFCYRRIQYCKKVLDNSVKDDQLFVFICKADENEKGEVDYTNPAEHEKANPSYGITVNPEDLMADAVQAQNDPQQRKDFFAKSLNIYTSAMAAYFNIDEFKASDRNYNWSLKELARLPVQWYGGADLSKMFDLTAAALYGRYKDKEGKEIDICITHAFFPITQAYAKADEDSIPVFGWKDDGWLTMCNNPTVHYDDVVKWFLEMRRMGFKIKRVGFDKKFGREFFIKMRKAKFKIVHTAQLYWVKSQGFRRIERKVKDGEFYYLHSQAYEYCVGNVKAVEESDDVIRYEKVMPNNRIDLFDASDFACFEMLEDISKTMATQKWLHGGVATGIDDKKGA